MLEEQAMEAATKALIEAHPEEWERTYALALHRNGAGSVKIQRTIYKMVSEIDAEILCRNGWEVVNDDT